MDRDQRQQTRSSAALLATWVSQAEAMLADRADIDKAGDRAAAGLRHSIKSVVLDGAVAWHALPLHPSDGRALADIARQFHQPSLSADEARVLDALTSGVSSALREVRSVTGARRFLSGRKKRDAGEAAASFLDEFYTWGTTTDVPALLQRVATTTDAIGEVSIADVLQEKAGFRARFGDLGDPVSLAGATLQELPQAIASIAEAVKGEARYRSDAVRAGEAIRERDVRALLSEMPVERLKDATRDRLRISPLKDAGILTVQAVLDWGGRLEHLPGIGNATAVRMRGAAQTLWQTTYEEMPVRIDVQSRARETTELLGRLGAWDAMRRTRGAATDIARAEALGPLAHSFKPDLNHLVLFPAGATAEAFRDAVDAVLRRARTLSAARAADGQRDPWEDFLSRPADYFAMLSELGFLTEDRGKTHGDLPDEIVAAVRALELNAEYLTAALRGYQSFGARFALVQRKVIIGDEMGLGKTVESLAVLAHLRAQGSYHSLVVCPAAVVTNWMREVAGKSTLRPHRVHGPSRDAAVRNWIHNGGVAVTTFETLGWLETHVSTMPAVGCVVVDEAHYIKNPAARRTQRVSQLLTSVDRAILLTGTPLENRIDEFRNLVGYLRPDLVVSADELSPRRFRQQVAPAYLRRNQEDVLTELPELVEVNEWLPMTSADARAYRDAVAAGNFMAMRQAAMLQGTQSEKVQRLVEIVEEAEDNNRRVIVFSHFRNVLDQVTKALPGEVFGPLTGSVPAAARQTMVDQFSNAGHGAVLVAQIIAGGVGLNIQAASVVVICEPQLKPTTEWQAIARAHRMGQLNSVQVHRLLSEEGVDQRITEILARKTALFEDFARVSETAGSAPEAFDISEADLARDVVAAERERLFASGSPA